MVMSRREFIDIDYDSGGEEEEEGDPASQVKYFSNFMTQGGHIRKWYSM